MWPAALGFVSERGRQSIQNLARLSIIAPAELLAPSFFLHFLLHFLTHFTAGAVLPQKTTTSFSLNGGLQSAQRQPYIDPTEPTIRLILERSQLLHQLLIAVPQCVTGGAWGWERKE